MNSLLFIPLFAVADRVAGGDYIAHIQAWAKDHAPPWVQIIVNARSTVWVWLALMILFAFTNLKLLELASAWALWRLPGWGFLFSGKIDPRTPAEVIRYFLRQCFALVAVPALMWLGGSPWSATLAMILYAGAAALLGRVLAWFADRRPGYDANTWIELARGACYGLAVVIGSA